MKKISNYLFIFVSILTFTLLPIKNVNAETYKNLDFYEVEKGYMFDNGVKKYGDLETEGWELTKDGHDYTLHLKDVKASKISLPKDDADINCTILNCGEKPRETNITVILDGENYITGYASEDGFIAHEVKNLTIKGSGSLTINSNHGMNLYTSTTFEKGLKEINVTSKTMGINVMGTVKFNDVKLNLNAALYAMLVSDDIVFDGTTVDATVKYTENYDVIKAYGNINVKDSTINTKNGESGLVGGSVDITNSTVSDADGRASDSSIKTTNRKDGHLTIGGNSNITLNGKMRSMFAAGNITLNEGTYNLTSSTIREGVVKALDSVYIGENAKVKVNATGFGITSSKDNGEIILKKGSSTTVMFPSRKVAGKYDVDGHGLFADKIVVEEGAYLEAKTPNHVFGSRPTFASDATYMLQVSKYVETTPGVFPTEIKSREYISTFHSSYLYVKTVYPTVEELPTVEAGKYLGNTEEYKLEENKVYCGINPTFTVNAPLGITKVTLNGEEVKDFDVNNFYKKTFRIIAGGKVSKVVKVIDQFGNSKSFTITLYATHDLEKRVVSETPSTCTTQGHAKYEYYCTHCGNLIKTEEVTLPLAEHSYGDWEINEDNNTKTRKCNVCGHTETVDINVDIDKANMTLSNNTYVYDGEAKKPVVTLTYKDKKLVSGVDYTVKYKDNVEAGTATVEVVGKNNYVGENETTFVIEKKDNKLVASNIIKTYSTKNQTVNLKVKQEAKAKLTYKSNNSKVTVDKNGKLTIKAKFIGSATITISASEDESYNAASTTVTVTVNPSKPSITSVKNTSSKKMVIKWKKDTSVKGYEVEYSTSKNFAKSTIKKITKNSTVSYTASKLTKKKTYYVRVRSYKVVDGKTYYSSYSTVKKVKISK